MTPEQGDAEHVSVLGVDLGITNIATTSTGRFWSGAELNHWHREYEKRRSDLQQTGTRWAIMRTFSESVASRLGGSNKCFTRSRTSWLRKLSKTTVRISCSSNSTASANAYLTRRRFTKWAFHRLYEYVTYKAESEGFNGETD